MTTNKHIFIAMGSSEMQSISSFLAKWTQSALRLQCLVAIPSTMEGDSGFSFFSHFLFWQRDVKSDPEWRPSPLLSVQTRRSPQRDGVAQENRSMAAKLEQHEPPRLISPSGAQINSYCFGRRWYIGCIRRQALFILFFWTERSYLDGDRGGLLGWTDWCGWF